MLHLLLPLYVISMAMLVYSRVACLFVLIVRCFGPAFELYRSMEDLAKTKLVCTVLFLTQKTIRKWGKIQPQRLKLHGVCISFISILVECVLLLDISMAMQQEPINWRYLPYVLFFRPKKFQGISPQFIWPDIWY